MHGPTSSFWPELVSISHTLVLSHISPLLRTCSTGLSETRPGTPVEVRRVPAYLDGPECVINTPESEGLAGDELKGSEVNGDLTISTTK